MDWVVSVSETERASGFLQPETAIAVYRALRAQGAVVLRRVFSTRIVEGLHREYSARFGAMNAGEMAEQALLSAPNEFRNRGLKRFEISPRMDDAFADPAVIANPLLWHFLPSLLGEEMRLSVFVIVVSFPGATMQHVHRDHPHLFPEVSFGAVLPVFAINIAVPLVNIDHKIGPTGVWLGSHLWPNDRTPKSEGMTTIPLERGDCMLLDYRTIHAGLANSSRRSRPILYMTYNRKWFFDEANYTHHSSLNMSLETFLALPEYARPILLRAFSQAMHSKHMADAASTEI